MPEHWIKVEVSTPDKPEVVQMAGALSMDQDCVAGKLLRLWIWADTNSVDGHDLSVTDSFLDRLTHCPGFAVALRGVGWLSGRDGRLTIPNFCRHNGQSAKSRALAQDRQAKSRSRRDKSVTKTSPEGEIEIEDNTPPPPARGPEVPDELLTEGQAMTQAHTAGVPEDFARYVFPDWESRGGKDGAGVKTPWAGYVKKRWNREQQEWTAGTHRGKQKGGENGKHRPTELDRDRSRTGISSTAGHGLRSL